MTSSPTSGLVTRRRLPAVAAVEVALVGLAVALDVLVPTLVVLVLAGVSLAVRRAGWSSLGFHEVTHPLALAGSVLGVVLVWTLVQVGLVMPVLEHVTGERQDLSAFDDLQGNPGLLAGLLLATWTLAAFGPLAE